MKFYRGMQNRTTGMLLLCFLLFPAVSPAMNDSQSPALPEGRKWAGFRGNGSSNTTAAGLPLRWSEAKNIDWRVQLPGFGQSSPVVWDDKVFITSVDTEDEDRLVVIRLDLETGKTIWEKRFKASRQIEYTRMIARSAPTPAVDHSGVYVFFGSGDVLKLSHDGDKLWSRSLVEEFGAFKGNHGVAASPVLYDDRLMLLIAHEGPSYAIALNAATGETLWKQDRKPAVSWSTPLVTRNQGRNQLVISSNGTVEALDIESGERLWYTHDIVKNTVASPLVYEDLIIAGSSESGGGRTVRLGGQGDITADRIAWRGGWASSFGSPLVHGSRVYITNRAGVVACLDAASGKEIWKHRLGESCWASPAAAGDRLYFFTKNGLTVVLAGNQEAPKILAENKLPVGKDNEVYGVALVDRKILLRTGSALTCIQNL
ncbi:MAG: PQQ-binding-like beta-propeller repeat protein [Acidobacteriota bacterium]|nr:PQQ-binding-like beta-propeller repeat protein [Acidobacteriota bacterium]